MRFVLNQESADRDMRLFIRALGPAANRVIARCLNRAVAGVRTDGAREAVQVYNVRQAEIKKSFRLYRAQNGLLEAEAVASGRRIPLIRFGARPSEPGRRPPVGASVRVKSSRKVIRGSFAARLKSGHVGLFTRDGEDRLPVSQKYGPSVPEMLGTDRMADRILARAEERFNRDLTRELAFALNRAGAR